MSQDTPVSQNVDNMLLPRPPSVVERYFKKKYKTDVLGKTCEDQVILIHSNKICVVCIAKSHPIISEKKIVKKVNFQGDGWSRVDTVISGKNKRGAQWLERTAPLCHVICEDDSVYVLCCCIKGQLVEVNRNLMANPSLLSSKPNCEGYLAVILPGLKWFDWEVERLKTEDAYQAVLKGRMAQTDTNSCIEDETHHTNTVNNLTSFDSSSKGEMSPGDKINTLENIVIKNEDSLVT